MRVAIITDQHFGVRGDHVSMINHLEKFYSEYFFPILERENIKTILDLGDTFDRRKYINFNTLNAAKRIYFDRIENEGYTLHTIVGNHTAFYKNTNRVNTLGELFSHYSNIHNYDSATEVEFDGLRVLLVPWITKDNYEKTMETVTNTTAEVCMGHFEFHGFEMYRGAMNDHGYSHTLFTKFDQVFSGHFHHKSTKDNVHYLGSPYEMSWSDYDDERGFHIYDTHTRQLTYYRNPYRMFHKIVYDDARDTEAQILGQSHTAIENSYVKIIVKNKENPYLFDRFVDRVNSYDPIYLQVVEDNLNLNLEDDSDIIDEAQDTITIIRNYVDNMNIDKGDRIKSVLQELYYEALSND